jgi:HD-like signal output (HDOD) protein
MSQLVEKVSQDIIKALESDQLVLPTLPEVALRVREVAEDPDASIDQMGKVIGSDAALTARLIKVANSPLLRGSKEITDLKMALARLGIEYTCNIATGLAMSQMFQATSDLVDKRLRDVWTRSSEVAGICHVMCKHRTKLRPDQATLAGLVHRIGVLPILTYAEENPSLLRDSFTLDTVIEALNGPIGDRILQHWGFPEPLIHVPTEHVNFSRKLTEPDYADIVTVAVLQSYMGSNHPLAQVDYASVTAFERLGLDSDMESAEGDDLSAEMEAAMAMLQ